MAYEIERKFLVDTEKFDTLEGGRVSVQGYISQFTNFSQVRVSKDMTRHKGYINIKGYRKNSKRLEVQSSISEDEANALLCEIDEKNKIYKKRITKQFAGNEWSIDVYDKLNLGLVIAEIELPVPDYKFIKPEWALIEVTNDDSFYNVNLTYAPYKTWSINNLSTVKVERIGSESTKADVPRICDGGNTFAFDKVFSKNEQVRLIPKNKNAIEYFGDKIIIGHVSKKSSANKLLINYGDIEWKDKVCFINMDIINRRHLNFTIDSLENKLNETDFISVNATGNNEIIHGTKVGQLTSYSINPLKPRILDDDE